MKLLKSHKISITKAQLLQTLQELSEWDPTHLSGRCMLTQQPTNPPTQFN
jgi:hypothetical protein